MGFLRDELIGEMLHLNMLYIVKQEMDSPLS